MADDILIRIIIDQTQATNELREFQEQLRANMAAQEAYSRQMGSGAIQAEYAFRESNQRIIQGIRDRSKTLRELNQQEETRNAMLAASAANARRLETSGPLAGDLPPVATEREVRRAFPAPTRAEQAEEAAATAA